MVRFALQLICLLENDNCIFKDGRTNVTGSEYGSFRRRSGPTRRVLVPPEKLINANLSMALDG